ncbi:MAG: FG-GAP-like repeat-containing protein, partial [Pirellulales bacterium]
MITQKHCQCIATFLFVAVLVDAGNLRAVTPTQTQTTHADHQLASFFKHETMRLQQQSLTAINNVEEWEHAQAMKRRRLFTMFGLDGRLDQDGHIPTARVHELKPQVTGRLEFRGPDSSGCIVEKLHFQSEPGLYVTANLYIPRDASPERPSPAVLYLCGHGRVMEDGISLGNKVHYQHHGAWLAEHGYIVLVLDTLQLGEIEGVHHGTYRKDRWWWPSRGYTPAGVEALNAIRGIDYLITRPEVDPHRIGVTGRSGGGAGSWWVAALDERIKTAVPVAGITDLYDHVVEGCVSGHCDCMFIVNTFRWDYPQLAALIYPRPLLLANTDTDRIFPLGGVMRTQAQLRRLYTLGKHTDLFGITITSGGHADTQDLQVPTIRWLDTHLGMGNRLIDTAARKRFVPKQLKVLTDVPADERNTRIDREFVPTAGPFKPPTNPLQWQLQCKSWLQSLKTHTFGGWPNNNAQLDIHIVRRDQGNGIEQTTYQFQSQPHVELDLIVLCQKKTKHVSSVLLCIVNQSDLENLENTWLSLLGKDNLAMPQNDDALALKVALTKPNHAVAVLAPRGIGASLWDQDHSTLTHNRRRFLLLGQTWEGMQVYDIRRGIQAIRSIYDDNTGIEPHIELRANGSMGALTMYASLFEPPVSQINVQSIPVTHDAPSDETDGIMPPSLLNVLRILDIPQVIAMASERSPIRIRGNDEHAFDYVLETADNLNWPEHSICIDKTAPSTTQQPRFGATFKPQVIDSEAGNICYAVVLSDIDADGHDDIVVVTEEAVLWYKNPNSHGQWVKQDIIRKKTPRDNVCIAPHDIDGDGRIDFALGASWPKTGSLHWLTRNDDLSQPWTVHDIGPMPSTHRMYWGDVLGQGKPQLVVSPLNAQKGTHGVNLTAFSIPEKPSTDRWTATILDQHLNRLHGHMHV